MVLSLLQRLRPRTTLVTRRNGVPSTTNVTGMQRRRDGQQQQPHVFDACRDRTRRSEASIVVRSSSSGSASRQRQMEKFGADPTAKRPNTVCDPYGQGGKPMEKEQAVSLLSTLDSEWTIEYHADGNIPQYLVRTCHHQQYGDGVRFLQCIGSVAEITASHYPISVQLQRTVRKHGVWDIRTTLKCGTFVLNGLSSSDFHLAMVRRRT